MVRIYSCQFPLQVIYDAALHMTLIFNNQISTCTRNYSCINTAKAKSESQCIERCTVLKYALHSIN